MDDKQRKKDEKALLLLGGGLVIFLALVIIFIVTHVHFIEGQFDSFCQHIGFNESTNSTSVEGEYGFIDSDDYIYLQCDGEDVDWWRCQWIGDYPKTRELRCCTNVEDSPCWYGEETII